MKKTFLSAEWRKLIIANYAIDPAVLQKYVPHGTELDFWQDKCYVSLIGFMFLNTRIKGIKVPFHTNFEEVNLRFYVTYRQADEVKRGVVFIKEIVPKPAITVVANTLYGEHYHTMPMAHSWTTSGDEQTIEYRWKHRKWYTLQVTAGKTSSPILPGSEEEFITQHFWGYTQLGPRKTSEYEVVHPRWSVYPVKEFKTNTEFGALYGSEFQVLDRTSPSSVFLAEGSGIQVKDGGVIIF